MFNLSFSHDNRRLYLPVVVLTAQMYMDMVISEKRPGSLVVRRGLIDTGATVTCLTSGVINDLSLSPVSQMSVTGVSGTRAHPAYSFYLGLAHSFDSPAFDMSEDIHTEEQGAGSLYAFHQEIVGPEVMDSPDHEIIVGMDIISKGLLMVHKDGARFQTPFITGTD